MIFNSQLLNRAKSEVYQLMDCSPDLADHTHTFGGDPRRTGAIPPGCRQRVHLFYEFDLTDPLVEMPSPSPKVTRLPLYYPLGNIGGPFKYRVVSDSKIEMLSNPYPKPAKDVPKPYPKPFQQETIYLQELGFDAKDPEWLWTYGALLGVGSLTETEKKATKKRFEQWHQRTFDEPLIERYDDWQGEQEDPDLDELVRMFTPFTQGMPVVSCPNPKCSGHAGKPLTPLMFLQPDPDGYEDKEERRIDKLLAGRDSGQLIWMVCPHCLSVVVDNPCT